MTQENQDEFFRKIMKKSALKMPFEGVEDELMEKIEAQETPQSVWDRNIVFSWISFIAGTIFGVVLTLWLPQLEFSFMGIKSTNLILLFELVLAVVIVLNLEKLILFTRHKMKTFINSKSSNKPSFHK